MRILQGMVDIASQGGYGTLGLRANGFDADFAVFESCDFSAVLPDKVLYEKGMPPRLARWAKSSAFALGALAHYDAFHFHFKTSMLPYHMDIPLARTLGKRVFMEYHGTDIRQGLPWTKGNPQGYLYEGYRENPDLLRQVRTLNEKVTGIIFHDAELAWYLPEENRTDVFYIPLRIETSYFETNVPENDSHRPLIVHMPSNGPIKGTRFISDTMEELKSGYDFEFISTNNLPNQEVRALCKRADLIIDQVILGTYGVLALEAMSQAKPVICFMREDLLSTYPKGLPIVNATRETLRDAVVDLLESPSKRRDLGIAGREYAMRYHEARNVAVLLSELYETGIGPSSPQEAYARVSSLYEEKRKMGRAEPPGCHRTDRLA